MAKQPYFADRVPDPAYRPTAGSLPTVIGDVRPCHKIPSSKLYDDAVRRPERFSDQSRVSLPGSVPVVIDAPPQHSDVAAMARGNAPTGITIVEGAPSAIVEPAIDPTVRRLGSFEATVDPGAALAPVAYPREPIQRHKRKRRIV